MDHEVNQAGGKKMVMKRTFATMEASKIDFGSNRASGRILEYDVQTKETIVLMANLNFPNGFVIKNTEVGKTTFVLSETLRMRVLEFDVLDDPGNQRSIIDSILNNPIPEEVSNPLKVWTGEGFKHSGGLKVHKGRISDVRLFRNTPGLPDNITLADDGKTIWVALVTPISKQNDPTLGIFEMPSFIRKLIPYLPAKLQPAPIEMALAIKYNLQTKKPVEYIFEGNVHKGTLGKLTHVAEIPEITKGDYGSRTFLFGGIDKSFIAKVSLP